MFLCCIESWSQNRIQIISDGAMIKQKQVQKIHQRIPKKKPKKYSLMDEYHLHYTQ